MTGGRSGIPNPTPIPDTTPSTSTITSLTEGAIVLIGKPVTITGTASDAGGGSVVRVEVSVDGGTTFSPATGTNAWSFNWTPSALGRVTIKSRAVDNTGNVQNPPVEIHVTVNAPPTSTITFPISGATVLTGVTTYITGTASDTGGGSVARVEVSVDGGTTFSAAMGATSWSFSWTPTTPGQATIRSRAADNNGSAQDPTTEITVTVRAPITIRVPSDQPTIQAAINVADYGDTVMVAPGTYVENINFGGKAITVTSESGPQVTIIDGGNAGQIVSFTSGEARDSVLNGFTLQNGRDNGASVGGGITILASSPKITNNVIRNNQACIGGGIGIRAGSPLIQLNTITNNITGDLSNCGKGGGISVEGASSAEILDNVISNNAAQTALGGVGAGIFLFNGTSIVKGNIINGNVAQSILVQGGGGGGGLLVDGPSVIVQNLIVGNQASGNAGLALGFGDSASGPIVVNNTIADNDASSGASVGVSTKSSGLTELTNNIIVAKPGQTGLSCSSFDQSAPTIRFNNVFSAGGMAYTGTCSDMAGTNGNISLDPLFTNPTQGDYHLQQGSPSIDSGDNMAPNLPDTDIDGDPRIMDGDGNGTAIVDMGVYEFPAQNSTREIRFSKITLDREFRSEGVAVADINRDGRMDVVAGNLWYEAPAWTPHEIQPVKQFDAANGYSNSFINFAADINNDGWPDQIRIDFPGSHRVVWNENPKGQNQHWVEHTLFRNACNESPAFATIHGAGKNPSLVFSFDDAQMAWYEPARVAGAEFMAHPISVQFTKEQAIDGGVFRHSHGLGVGDVNGDGRNDVIIRAGYWEAPADPRQPNWKFVAANLGEECAQMHVYDVNGDGRKDVISSSAHGIGVWLHERLPDGKFVTRLIDDSFSQSHSLELADINGDGLKDIVTGKRFWAHGPTGDVNPGDPAVVVWFELRREGRQVRWIKHEIDNDSGVGTQFVVADVNHDKLPDIVTSNKKGVFVFLQHQ